MAKISQEARNRQIVEFTSTRKTLADYYKLLPDVKPQYVADLVMRLAVTDRLFACRAKLDTDARAIGYYFGNREERDAFKAEYELMNVQRAKEKARVRDIERLKRKKAERAAAGAIPRRAVSNKVTEKMAVNRRIADQRADRKASNHSRYELTQDDLQLVQVLPGFEGKPRHWVDPASIPRFRYGGGS
jgi:hypothetical protein